MYDASRFRFIADALDATGGFRPFVTWNTDEDGLTKPASASPSHLIPYPRESVKKFAARSACATYENHLRAACERFVGYINKRPPMRTGVEGPLHQAFVNDADWKGNALDVFWQGFMVDAKARGSMLLLMDMPPEMPDTMADQIAQRAVPYLTPVKPELVEDFKMNDQGAFDWIKIGATIADAATGQTKHVSRYWDAEVWRILEGDTVLQEGTHPFKACPMLIFTEGTNFPHYGNFEQIAQLSKRLFNARSELDEILRSQTFSLLTFQVPPEQSHQFDAAKVAGVIGTHNMLVHGGASPQFIAPPDGPARVYIDVIAKLEEAIQRIGMQIESPNTIAAQQSGVALTIRFQTLNGALASFSRKMEDLERRVWDMFATALGFANRVTVNWANDYSLSDIGRELEILSAMQMAAMPEAVITEQKKTVISTQFSTADQEDKDELMASIEESAHERRPGN